MRVMVMDVDGSNPRWVERGLAYGTGWSPDGTSVVTADVDRGEQDRSLWIIDIEHQRVTKVAAGPLNNPTWGPTFR